MGEYIFVIVAITIIIILTGYMRRFRVTKTEMILNVVSFIILTGLFIWSLSENFSNRQAIGTCIFILIGAFSLYRTYKKYKRDSQTFTD